MTRSEIFQNLLLTSNEHLNKCKSFSEFENDYIDKNYENFLIEVKYKLTAKTIEVVENIDVKDNESQTLFKITQNLLKTPGLIERFKYKEKIEGLTNHYEISTDFDYVMKFDSDINKFELNNRYCPYFGIKSLENKNNTKKILKGVWGKTKLKESLGVIDEEYYSKLINNLQNLKEIFEKSKKQIKKDIKDLFSLVLDKKIKKYNELSKIPELKLDRDVDNKILSYESKQDLCKPLIEDWLSKNVTSDVRKYFYPNFIISLYDEKWILFDFDADEYVNE